MTVDSFGNLWQSDNDEAGNAGCRINYVMEFGDFGYRDSNTGEGWGETVGCGFKSLSAKPVIFLYCQRLLEYQPQSLKPSEIQMGNKWVTLSPQWDDL